MTEKNLDKRGRWRSKTVTFRISPEEAALLNSFVATSGLSKQDYLCHCALHTPIKVFSNPRIYNALSRELEAVLEELRRIENASEVRGDLVDLIEHLNTTLYGFKDGAM